MAKWSECWPPLWVVKDVSWDSKVTGSKPCSNSWSNLLKFGIHSTASAWGRSHTKWYAMNVPSKQGQHHACRRSGGWINIRMPSYQYRNSHWGDKTILRSSYLHNGISFTSKTTSLYWFSALAPFPTKPSPDVICQVNEVHELVWREMTAFYQIKDFPENPIGNSKYWIFLKFHCSDSRNLNIF